MFSAAIRSLIKDHFERNTGYSAISKTEALRIIRVPTVHVPLYFAIKTFKPKEYGTRDSIRPDEILNIVTPFELASLLSVFYLYRRARKLSSPDEWPVVSQLITEQSEIGGHFGASITDVGIGSGLLMGAFRPFSLFAFSLIDLDASKKYRRSLKSAKTLYNIPTEEKYFKCTHPEIGAELLQKFGFGIAIANAYSDALILVSNKDDDFVAGDKIKFQVAAEWIDSLTLSSLPPGISSIGASPDDVAISNLVEVVKAAKSKSREMSWLEKTRADYPKQDELYKLNSPKKKSAYFDNS